MITFIVATIGRPSLLQTLRSIECWPGDEILMVSNKYRTSDPRVRYVDCAPGHDWGHTERNFAQQHARGQYIAHIDDDDLYAPGARTFMEDHIHKHPSQPALFRMRAPNGITLWRDEKIYCGNVGTPQILMPNRSEMFGTWGSFVGGDCAFLESCKWVPEDYVWRSEIVALLGHNFGE